MRSRKILWGLPLLGYLLFSFWYTNTGGPLSAAEVEHYLGKMQALGRNDESLDRLRIFLQSDTGNQFLMINNIDMNETPGNVAGALPGESSDQIMDRYMEHMYPALFARASHPIFFGNAVHTSLDVVGIQNAEVWDRAAVFRYRSRRDLMDITSNPAFAGKHHFKLAALTKTVAYPIESQLYLSDPRFLLALILLCITALSDIALFGRRR
ncbi:MAG: hypothetical protein HON25_10950 [Gammaproteobacteria bacterium]|jgi:hypothetical protein|nr:hypothetical protein [Gammaproteobacteria bacterium]MBT5682105.1 hypothetical protein [Gammaproteobacteria bacterium]MBT6024657.1 hypothetical protein [Gammaproteobacteria bacterium]MBT6558908.1 hypothetical protein [Gammaproteobacteria bacterium]